MARYFIREIWFIRHGESESNSGLRTYSTVANKLTPKGIEQSKTLDTQIVNRPDLIVSSKYVRTTQTAAFTLKRFPDVPHEVWDIHEFTFLPIEKCINTTGQERKPWNAEYWGKLDPNFSNSGGAESFADVTLRAKKMWEKLKNLTHEKFIVLFTHGIFLNLFRYSFASHFSKPTSKAMANFQNFENISYNPNCGILKLKIDSFGEAWLQPYVISSHLNIIKNNLLDQELDYA